MAFVNNSIFQSIIQLMSVQEVHIKKEALFTVGNILTTLDPLLAQQLINNYDDLLLHYLKGLELISREELILHILDTIEHFGKIDK